MLDFHETMVSFESAANDFSTCLLGKTCLADNTFFIDFPSPITLSSRAMPHKNARKTHRISCWELAVIFTLTPHSLDIKGNLLIQVIRIGISQGFAHLYCHLTEEPHRAK
jgi:hypothetical protein